ncbi:CHAD domain-containing protein [Paenibacillus sp. NFR01]|uniref:CHAD domain-containing protein n=1 Tax=Paenibacillus sp. NFR01 TaxID=1566279 RepID=UPI0008C24A9E|nr:CHAD domain-containing protein [Paenibacillus sp. NFR01]SEU29566.1 CHAD domain-containing protein [Paenibacillus sp. NFR01]
MTAGQLTKDRQSGKSRQWEQALNKLYVNFRDYSKAARRDFDDEDIHQARVNSRKLLTLLAILDPEHTATADLYTTFKQAQKRLGKVRDADVLIASFKERRKLAADAGEDKTADLLKAVIKHQKKKRETYRKKLKDELANLAGSDLDERWEAFLTGPLEGLAGKRDANVVMRELEVAFEQQKKVCKTLFKTAEPDPKEAFEALHKLRISAKRLRYTANAAAFALNQKFRADEEIYKEIQDQLGEINDKRVWLDTLQAIGREELDAGKKVWAAFTDSLHQEVLEALHRNDVVPVGDKSIGDKNVGAEPL